MGRRVTIHADPFHRLARVASKVEHGHERVHVVPHKGKYFLFMEGTAPIRINPTALGQVPTTRKQAHQKMAMLNAQRRSQRSTLAAADKRATQAEKLHSLTREIIAFEESWAQAKTLAQAVKMTKQSPEMFEKKLAIIGQIAKQMQLSDKAVKTIQTLRDTSILIPSKENALAGISSYLRERGMKPQTKQTPEGIVITAKHASGAAFICPLTLEALRVQIKERINQIREILEDAEIEKMLATDARKKAYIPRQELDKEISVVKSHLPKGYQLTDEQLRELYKYYSRKSK